MPAVTQKDDVSQTLYFELHCSWCDQPAGERHLPFCLRGKGIHWPDLRRWILARDLWSCRYCGWHPEHDDEMHLLHVDHVRPKSDGGRDVPWNLVTACRSCNCSKGASIAAFLPHWERRRADYEAAVEDAYLADLGVFG